MTELLTLTAAHESNVYSQTGEDGIIRTICQALGINRGAAVEFGAWDGIYLSNTAALREAGWDVCLIEGDTQRFEKLSQQFGSQPNVVAVNAWVMPSGESTLDRIFAKHFSKPIDVLSIDIDGDDYHIFASLQTRARIIVIELNPTIPPPIDRPNPMGTAKGSSLAALARLGKEKGYDLVHATTLNAFFVDASRNGRIKPKTPLEAFRWDHTSIVARDFDGENWFGSVDGAENGPLNLWDGLPAAHITRHPASLLGRAKQKVRARKRFYRLRAPVEWVRRKLASRRKDSAKPAINP